MRNLLCSLFTCFLWQRKVLNFVHESLEHHHATVVFYQRPWDKNTEYTIVNDMAKAKFYQKTRFSGW